MQGGGIGASAICFDGARDPFEFILVGPLGMSTKILAEFFLSLLSNVYLFLEFSLLL